jgi:hypothetical protein
MGSCLRFGTIVLAGVLVGTLSGAANAQNKCAAGKIKATGKKQSCITMAYAHAAQSSADPKQEDIAECELKFATAFARLEARSGCVTSGDAAAIEGKVDAFVADLVTELDLGNPSRCQANKMKAAARKAKCLLYLDAREATQGLPAAPIRIQRCRDRLPRQFAAFELGPGCDTTGDADAIEAKVDAFVADVDTELPWATTTTTEPTTTTTTLP